MLSIAMMLTLSNAVPDAQLIPVQVDPFRPAARGARWDSLAEDVTDGVRRALNASGRFVVVRADLHEKVQGTQRRNLSAAYADGGDELGRFARPKVLVGGRFKVRGKSEVTVFVSFTDIATLKSLPGLDFAHRVEGDPETSAQTLALLIAEKTADATGAAVDQAGKEQMQMATRRSTDAGAEALFRRGRQQQARFSYPGMLEAEKAYLAALEIDPGHWIVVASLLETWSNLGWMGASRGEPYATAIGRHRRGLALVKKALAAAPDFYLLRREAARFLLGAGKTQEARELLTQLDALQPRDPALLVLRSLSETIPERQLPFLERALAVDPYNIEVRILLSETLPGVGRLEEGLGHARFALERIDPSNVMCKVLLGYNAYVQGNFVESERLLAEATQETPVSGHALLNVAYARAALSRPYEADLSRALETYPDGLVDLLGNTSNLGVEEEWRVPRLSDLVAKHPDQPLLAQDLAQLLIRSSDPESHRRAVAILQNARRAKLPPHSDLVLGVTLAAAHGRLDQNTEALAALEAIDRDHLGRRLREAVEHKIAWALVQADREAEARAILGRLRQNAADDDLRFVATLELARLHRWAKEFDLARRFTDEADRLVPQNGTAMVAQALILVGERRALIDALPTAPAAARKSLETRIAALAKEALEAFANVFADDESAGYAWRSYGELLLSLEREAEGLAALRRAAELSSANYRSFEDALAQAKHPELAAQAPALTIPCSTSRWAAPSSSY